MKTNKIGISQLVLLLVNSEKLMLAKFLVGKEIAAKKKCKIKIEKITKNNCKKKKRKKIEIWQGKKFGMKLSK